MEKNITYEAAIALVLERVRAGGERTVPLPETPGEVLARDVSAHQNIPPFPRATMDGFAVRWTGGERDEGYRVVGTVVPGQSWCGDPGAASCLKIMTGAAVPQPFDTVIPVEKSSRGSDGAVRFLATSRRGDNIAVEGEDAREGELLIPRGTLLRTRHVPTLAAEGVWDVPVYARPTVAVLATGGELREPWEDAPALFIRNTNVPFLVAALRQAGYASARYLGIVPDETGPLLGKIREGLAADFLLITGGVSMGDVDLVPACLEACGVTRILHKVSMKPGKSLYVGQSERGSLVVGFPGNPVAVMVHLSMFVQPLLLKAAGAREFLPKPVLLPLAAVAVNRSERKKFSLGRILARDGGTCVQELSSQGSGDFISARCAEGIFEIPLGVTRIPAGEMVKFYPVWGDFYEDGGSCGGAARDDA